MDTKLKRTHKVAVILITLCILLPAFLITSLYPRIGKEVKEKIQAYQAANEGREFEAYEVQYNFVNYAVEASYHIYADMLKEAGWPVDYAVLDYAGWTNDYLKFGDAVYYHAKLESETGASVTQNYNDESDLNMTVGTLSLGFDARGNLTLIHFDGEVFEDESVTNFRERANESVEQYLRNAKAYEGEYGVQIDEEQLIPKNFHIEISMDEDSAFISDYIGYYYYSVEDTLFQIGVEWIILAAALFVLLMALVLPFFRGLHTGWEKLFCLPFEGIVVLAGCTIGGIVGMFYALGETCRITEYPKLELVGINIAEQTQIIVLLVLNFLGWAACFFGEYIVVASFRQFLCRPVLYLRNRVLCVRFVRWVKRQCVRLYHYVSKIDLREKLNSSILKVVLMNFVVLAAICCMWFFGIIGLIVYSVALYVVLYKYGEKIQMQYQSILQATEQMAEGNLKISMEQDLGVFQPIGDSLGKVQQGFEKAVVEEAKSQNMKTELITNVSHDLKTPLTAIITYVDLLKKEDITEEERKAYIDTLDKKSQRLKVLIEDLFEVSKAQSGNVQMNFMEVDIVSLLKQVKSEMADQIEAGNLTFRWNLPEEKVLLSLDGQRTYRVFENLIGNALKYSMPYSRVYVDIVDSETSVQVIFKNTSAQELNFEPERLTERFVRGDASRKSEGSGLGLAIAKSFVELQNGQFAIDVDGDLFKVILTWKK